VSNTEYFSLSCVAVEVASECPWCWPRVFLGLGLGLGLKSLALTLALLFLQVLGLGLGLECLGLGLEHKSLKTSLLSITCLYYVKTAKYMITRSVPHDIPGILSFLVPKILAKFKRGHPQLGCQLPNVGGVG